MKHIILSLLFAIVLPIFFPLLAYEYEYANSSVHRTHINWPPNTDTNHDMTTQWTSGFSQKTSNYYIQKYRHDFNHLMKMTCEQLLVYFISQGYTQDQLLQSIDFYRSDEFIKLIQSFQYYPSAINSLYKQYAHRSMIAKFFQLLSNSCYKGFDRRIVQLKKELDNTILNAEDAKNNDKQKNSSIADGHLAINESPTQQIIHALKHSQNYDNCIQKCAELTHNALSSGQLSFNEEAKSLMHYALNMAPTIHKEEHFVFNVTLVNRILSDAANPRVEVGEESNGELLKYALTEFIMRLNPVVQVAQWIDLITSTACFVADVTVGRLYLSPEKYQARINGMYDTLAALSWNNLSQVTTQQWVQIGAHIAADCVFAGGLTRVLKYLKEIDMLNNVKNRASTIVDSFKEAMESKLASNKLKVSPDGTVIKYVHEPSIVGKSIQIIVHSKEQLENLQLSLMQEVTRDLVDFRKKYHLTRKGFGEFSNKYIKINYKHIFGMELSYSKKGIVDIGGFHHDFMKAVESKGIIEFSEKIMYPNDCYFTQLLFNGKIAKYKATFFPAYWSKEQVIDAIFEAYDNFIESGAQSVTFKKGMYNITGITNKNISIFMSINKNGKIITAYPLLK